MFKEKFYSIFALIYEELWFWAETPAVHVGPWVRQLPVERKVHPSVWDV